MNVNPIIEAAVKTMIAKGWAGTTANVSHSFDNGIWEISYAYIYPQADIGGNTVKTDSIYIGGYRLTDTDYHEALTKQLEDHPTVREFQTKKVLEAVKKITETAADLDIPADFLNPLTVLAEQLRTNILSAK